MKYKYLFKVSLNGICYIKREITHKEYSSLFLEYESKIGNTNKSETITKAKSNVLISRVNTYYLEDEENKILRMQLLKINENLTSL